MWDSCDKIIRTGKAFEFLSQVGKHCEEEENGQSGDLPDGERLWGYGRPAAVPGGQRGDCKSAIPTASAGKCKTLTIKTALYSGSLLC